MDENLQQLQSSIQRVENDIKETNRDIRRTDTDISDNERTIQKLNSLLETPFDDWDPKDQGIYGNAEGARKEKKALWDKDKSLRDKEKALWDKEKALREEKMLLLKQKDDLLEEKKQSRKSDGFKQPCKVSFYNNISKGIETDGWISFDDNIPSTSLKKLYIRESYRTIASSIINPGINKVIITGTPGIGKSLLLIYLLWKLVKKGKRVLIIYHPSQIYFDGIGGIFEISTGNLPRETNHAFWNESLWCLFDAKGKNDLHLNELPYSSCTFILSMSPRRDLVNDFQKPPEPQTFYLPIWKKEELEAIAPLYPNAAEWRTRFEILGGIPRYVLEATTTTPTELIENACNACSLDDCIPHIGLNSQISDKSSVIHRLIHIVSEHPYTSCSVTYASRTALDMIVRLKGIIANQKTRELLQAAQGNRIAAQLCGYILEPYAIKRLEEGGSFKCRELVSHQGKKKARLSSTYLTIPKSTKIIEEKVEKGQTKNQLYIPENPNYPVVDAWMPGVGGFQITVSTRHPIKTIGEEDLAKLENKLYFVVPSLIYQKFPRQTAPRSIEQYALEMPVEDWIKEANTIMDDATTMSDVVPSG